MVSKQGTQGLSRVPNPSDHGRRHGYRGTRIGQEGKGRRDMTQHHTQLPESNTQTRKPLWLKAGFIFEFWFLFLEQKVRHECSLPLCLTTVRQWVSESVSQSLKQLYCTYLPTYLPTKYQIRIIMTDVCSGFRFESSSVKAIRYTRSYQSGGRRVFGSTAKWQCRKSCSTVLLVYVDRGILHTR